MYTTIEFLLCLLMLCRSRIKNKQTVGPLMHILRSTQIMQFIECTGANDSTHAYLMPCYQLPISSLIVQLINMLISL